MSQNERYEALVRLENAPSPDATAGAAAGATGLALVGALVLGRRREGEGGSSESVESTDTLRTLEIKNAYKKIEMDKSLAKTGHWLDAETGKYYKLQSDGSMKIIGNDANGRFTISVLQKDGQMISRDYIAEGSTDHRDNQERIALMGNNARFIPAHSQQPNFGAMIAGLDPIHEDMTKKAFNQVRGFESERVKNIMKGIYDVDNPANSVFTALVAGLHKYTPTLITVLFGRSETFQTHVGYNQEEHAMRSRNEQSREVTREYVLNIADKLYSEAMDTNNHLSMAERDNRIGRLIHLVQDSYSEGHTKRNEKEEIELFNRYDKENQETHKDKDNEFSKLATERTQKILEMYRNGDSKEKYQKLMKEIFKLSGVSEV